MRKLLKFGGRRKSSPINVRMQPAGANWRGVNRFSYRNALFAVLMKHFLQPVERSCCRAVGRGWAGGGRAGGIRPRPWHRHCRRRHLRHGDEVWTARRQRNRSAQWFGGGAASAGMSLETAGCGPASVAVFGAAFRVGRRQARHLRCLRVGRNNGRRIGRP